MRMVFVGACIMPHGALPFDGDPDSESEACRERYKKLPADLAGKFTNLYRGMIEAGEAVAQMDPDIILLHSPHGIKLTSAVGVHVNKTAAGTAVWNNEWAEFKAELDLAPSQSEALIDQLKQDGLAAEGISCFSDVVCPLMWGEVVPAWFILRSMKKPVRFILMSQALKPSPLDVSGLSEDLLQIGRSVSNFVSSSKEKIAVVISGDLSHVYHSDYPDRLYQPVKGWTLNSDHSAACAMERAFQGWILSVPDFSLFAEAAELPPGGVSWSPHAASPWLQRAAELQPRAYSCGLVGFILLHALLGQQITNDRKIASKITSCEAPTYYGLMAALFYVL